MDPAEFSTLCEGTPAMDMPMDNYDLYLHGRLDPGRDENVALMESVEVREPERDVSKMDDNPFFSSQNGGSSSAAIQSYPSTGMSNMILCLKSNPLRLGPVKPYQ